MGRRGRTKGLRNGANNNFNCYSDKEIAQNKQCPFCEGHGMHWGKKCGGCNGTGLLKVWVQLKKVYNAENDIPIYQDVKMYDNWWQ